MTGRDGLSAAARLLARRLAREAGTNAAENTLAIVADFPRVSMVEWAIP